MYIDYLSLTYAICDIVYKFESRTVILM